jgi:hypothetical protein
MDEEHLRMLRLAVTSTTEGSTGAEAFGHDVNHLEILSMVHLSNVMETVKERWSFEGRLDAACVTPSASAYELMRMICVAFMALDESTKQDAGPYLVWKLNELGRMLLPYSHEPYLSEDQMELSMDIVVCVELIEAWLHGEQDQPDVLGSDVKAQPIDDAYLDVSLKHLQQLAFFEFSTVCLRLAEVSKTWSSDGPNAEQIDVVMPSLAHACSCFAVLSKHPNGSLARLEMDFQGLARLLLEIKPRMTTIDPRYLIHFAAVMPWLAHEYFLEDADTDQETSP